MVFSSARKPEGGFQFISVVQLCMIWWAYQERLIRLRDVRVWFATHELLARRCQLKRGQTARYTYEELYELVGGGRDIPASLQRLQARGLLTWEPGTIGFPEQPPPGQEWAGLEAMLTQVRNHRRRVPVPRRLLRFIAGGCGRVVIATILGHLLRCLYYRNGQCRAGGFCKASWIAQVFGVNVRNVKAARRQLEAIGLLQRIEVPQWVRNRYGQKMTINLQWEPPAIEASAASPVGELPPPPEFSTPELPPPDSYTELPTGNIHQKPAAGRPAGALTALFRRAREAVRDGTALLDEPEPVTQRQTCVPARREEPQPANKHTLFLPDPTLHHILPADLRDTSRLLQLYTQATQAGLIGTSEADRLSFVGLAQHVVRYHPANPGGLFHELLTRRHFHFVTQEEEEVALRRLKRHLFGGGGNFVLQAVG